MFVNRHSTILYLCERNRITTPPHNCSPCFFLSHPPPFLICVQYSGIVSLCSAFWIRLRDGLAPSLSAARTSPFLGFADRCGVCVVPYCTVMLLFTLYAKNVLVLIPRNILPLLRRKPMTTNWETFKNGWNAVIELLHCCIRCFDVYPSYTEWSRFCVFYVRTFSCAPS